MAYSLLLEKILRILEFDRNRKCIGQQKITVDETAAVSLTPTSGANSAIITLEDGASATPTKSCRFYESGTAPTAVNGVPLGNLDTYEIIGPTCLANFKIIGVEAGKTHTLQILYYA